jgi:hypothetical protein
MNDTYIDAQNKKELRWRRDLLVDMLRRMKKYIYAYARCLLLCCDEPNEKHNHPLFLTALYYVLERFVFLNRNTG